MEFSTELTEALASLTESLADPEIHLHAALAQFVTVASLAISSLTSITVTVRSGARPISFTTSVRGRAALTTTSIRIPLQTVSDCPIVSDLVLRAEAPGAFVDLAADICFLTRQDPVVIVFDADLTATREVAIDDTEGTDGALSARSTIDRAIGILIDRGSTDQQALEHLRAQATQHDLTIEAEALAVLRDASGQRRIAE